MMVGVTTTGTRIFTGFFYRTPATAPGEEV
jgi:hypothetical protein